MLLNVILVEKPLQIYFEYSVYRPAPEILRFPSGPEPPSVCVSALMIDSAIWRIDDKRVRSHFTDLLSGILLHMCTKVNERHPPPNTREVCHLFLPLSASPSRIFP